MVDVPLAESPALTFKRACELYPEHEIIICRYRGNLGPGLERGVEAFLMVPKQAIAERLARGEPPPWFRHGEVMEVRVIRER